MSVGLGLARLEVSLAVAWHIMASHVTRRMLLRRGVPSPGSVTPWHCRTPGRARPEPADRVGSRPEDSATVKLAAACQAGLPFKAAGPLSRGTPEHWRRLSARPGCSESSQVRGAHPGWWLVLKFESKLFQVARWFSESDKTVRLLRFGPGPESQYVFFADKITAPQEK